jgi:protein SCO1/2
MERKILIAGSVFLGVLIFVAVAASLVKKQEFKGVVISPSPNAPEISLINQFGHPFSLATEKGNVVLIYFGYTNCPDNCPLTMAKLKEVLAELKNQSSNIVVIMVTTDPGRDSPEKLKNYLANFNPQFLGLSGSVTDLEKVWKDYGVTVLDGGETHSDRVYVIDQQGHFRLTFPFEMSPADIAGDLRILLDE